MAPTKKPYKVAKTPQDVDFTAFADGTYVRNGHSHGIFTTIMGAVAIFATWGTWIGGITCPFWVAALYLHGYHVATALTVLVLSLSLIIPPSPWPLFVQFILNICGWFPGGTSMAIDENIQDIDPNGPIMLCYHPHGVLPYGFILNGAARIHARKPPVYLPPLFQNLSTKSTGVVEPLLFKIPLIRNFLVWFNCAEPATKGRMHEILGRRVGFGILPGGSEEIILAERGKENIYIKKRAGFIKYALQHGYTIVIGYNFGESNLYHTFSWFKEARLNLMKKTGIMLFGFWGTWWCPILPRRETPIHTILGNRIDLPKITSPTDEDVAKYHKLYIEKLIDLFERHKARYGYGDRTLNLY